MAHVAYAKGKEQMLKGNVIWDDATSGYIRAMLVKSSYTPNANTHQYISDISASELVATSYARQSVTGRTLTINGTVVEIDSSNISFGAIGGATNDTIGGLVFYKYNASDSSALLLFYIDTSPDTLTNGGTVDFTIATFIASL
jgi:hypothetical protein